jgi:hypothetical protein
MAERLEESTRKERMKLCNMEGPKCLEPEVRRRVGGGGFAGAATNAEDSVYDIGNVQNSTTSRERWRKKSGRESDLARLDGMEREEGRGEKSGGMDEVENKDSRVGDGHLRQCSVLAENRDTSVVWSGMVTNTFTPPSGGELEKGLRCASTSHLLVLL